MFVYFWTPTALLSLFISSLVYFSTASAPHLLGKRLEISNLVADEIIIDYAHAGWKTEQVTYKLMLHSMMRKLSGVLILLLILVQVLVFMEVRYVPKVLLKIY